MGKYILNVKNCENGDSYCVLLFDNKIECERAIKIIKKFDEEWDKYPEEFETDDYDDELFKTLDINSINYELPFLESVYIR